jgi:putative transposase
MQVTRIAKLALYPNPGKLEIARYTYERHLKFAQHFVTQLYFRFRQGVKSLTTKGMGQLANQAQHKAQGILKAHFESSKETGNKSNVPQIKQTGCPAKIEKSKDSSFDYWLTLENLFSKMGRVSIPVKGHKRLTQWLQRGYKLNPAAEFHKDKNGKFYAIVFLQKEVEKANPRKKCLGIDVGIFHAVARSDGYLGRGCRKLLKLTRDRNAERRRQGHSWKSAKTFMRQMLDIEAKRAVCVALVTGQSLAFEDPKLLANLKPRGRIAMWARSYFARRVQVLAQEYGVFTVAVRPAYTSQTCSECGYCDAQNRVKSAFKCLKVGCGNSTDSEINASRVIALKGSENVVKILDYRSGSALKRSPRARRAS